MQLLDVPFSPNKDKTGYYIKSAEGNECMHLTFICVHVHACVRDYLHGTCITYVAGWAKTFILALLLLCSGFNRGGGGTGPSVYLS